MRPFCPAVLPGAPVRASVQGVSDWSQHPVVYRSRRSRLAVRISGVLGVAFGASEFSMSRSQPPGTATVLVALGALMLLAALWRFTVGGRLGTVSIYQDRVVVPRRARRIALRRPDIQAIDERPCPYRDWIAPCLEMRSGRRIWLREFALPPTPAKWAESFHGQEQYLNHEMVTYLNEWLTQPERTLRSQRV